MKNTLVPILLALGACAMQDATERRLAAGAFNSDAERAAYLAGQNRAAGLFAEELVQRGLVTACESDYGLTYVFLPETC